MAVSRGYHNYRGRKPRGKIALAVLLVLVILGAAAVMLLQQHIIYDSSGTPQLENPWKKDPVEEDEAPVDLDLVIQEPESLKAEEIHAFSMPKGPLTQAEYESACAAADPACNAVAVTVKDRSGKVYFDSVAAVSGAVNVEADTDAALAGLTGENSKYYTIARFSCFSDPKAANSDVEGMGLKNTGGFIFYDGRNSQWLDPAKAAARAYLCELAQEVAAMGFDEILLTDVSYPTEGKLDKIAYGEAARNANLSTFLEELRETLEPYSVAISMEVPSGVLSTGREDSAGLILSEIAPKVDRVYAAASPDEVMSFSSAVTFACTTTTFVPELAEDASPIEGNYLIS